MEQGRRSWKLWRRILFGIFILFLCIYYWKSAAHFLAVLLGAVSPLVGGGVIAYLVNILMSSYERHYFPRSQGFAARTRRPVCLTAAYLTLAAIVAGLIWLVIPELVDCVQVLLEEIPAAAEKLGKNETLMRLLPQRAAELLTDVDWKSYLAKAVELITTGIGGAVTAVVSAVSSVFSVVVTTLLSLIFSAYLLASRDRLSRQLHRLGRAYLKPAWRARLRYVLGVVNNCFHSYIVGQCIEAVILGVLCALGMLLFRFPYAGMIGALVGFTALIPVAGSYIGAFVGALMILTHSPLQALLFLVFLVVLQQLEGNLIYPRVVGSSVGLPGLWVLAAITVGGSLMGVLGILLSVPVAASLYRLLRDDLARRERARANAPEDAS